jgi:DNA-binding NtrC family response regulator
VEDDPAILNIVKKSLELLEYRVLAVSTPGEALQEAKNHTSKIHLLITDVIMPEINGQELAQALASIFPELRILFMSGYTADVIAHHGVLDEGINFLQKPFSIQKLAESVRKALGNSPA